MCLWIGLRSPRNAKAEVLPNSSHCVHKKEGILELLAPALGLPLSAPEIWHVPLSL